MDELQMTIHKLLLPAVAGLAIWGLAANCAVVISGQAAKNITICHFPGHVSPTTAWTDWVLGPYPDTGGCAAEGGRFIAVDYHGCRRGHDAMARPGAPATCESER